MAQPTPGQRRRPQPTPPPTQPQKRSGGSNLLRVLMWAGVAAVVLVAALAFITRGGGEGTVDTAPAETGIVGELKQAQYKKVKDEKRHSPEFGRQVVTEWWERAQAPERVIITDDSPYTEEGRLIVNAVTFTGADGKGNLTCQPGPEHAQADLPVIIEDAVKVRTGVKDGTIKADPSNNPGGFPYRGEFMGCLP